MFSWYKNFLNQPEDSKRSHAPQEARAINLFAVPQWDLNTGASALLNQDKEEIDLINAYSNAILAVSALQQWGDYPSDSKTPQATRNAALAKKALTATTEYLDITKDCFDVELEVIRSHSNYLLWQCTRIKTSQPLHTQTHAASSGRTLLSVIDETLALLRPNSGATFHPLTSCNRKSCGCQCKAVSDEKSHSAYPYCHQYSVVIAEKSLHPSPQDTYEPPDIDYKPYSAKTIIEDFRKFHSQDLKAMISAYLANEPLMLCKLKLRIEHIAYLAYLSKKRGVKASPLLINAQLRDDEIIIAHYTNMLIAKPKLSTEEKVLLSLMVPQRRAAVLLRMAETEGSVLAIPLLMGLDVALDDGEAQSYFDKLLIASKKTDADPSILCCLGRYYEGSIHSSLSSPDLATAAEYYLAAAKKQHAESSYRLLIISIAPSKFATTLHPTDFFQHALRQGYRKAMLFSPNAFTDTVDHLAMFAECCRFYLEDQLNGATDASDEDYSFRQQLQAKFRVTGHSYVLFHLALLIEFEAMRPYSPENFNFYLSEKIVNEFNKRLIGKDKDLETMIMHNVDLHKRIANLVSANAMQPFKALTEKTNTLGDEKQQPPSIVPTAAASTMPNPSNTSSVHP